MTSPASRNDGSASSAWQDDGPIDPSWAAPGPTGREPNGPVSQQSPSAQHATGYRRLLKIAIPSFVLAVLVATVGWFGGFEERTDTITYLPAGRTFVDGPFQFTLTRATVQREDAFEGHSQDVVVSGTVRNLSSQALMPSGDWFDARGRTDSQFEAQPAVTLGNQDMSGPQDVTPGIPPTRVMVDFTFPPKFNDTMLLVGIDYLTYGSHSVVSPGSDQEWDADSRGRAFVMQLPLIRLAPKS